MIRRFLPWLVVCSLAFAQQKPTHEEIVKLAKSKSPQLGEAIKAAFVEADLQKGTAYAGWGPDFVLPVISEKAPRLLIDDAPSAAKPARVKGSNLWVFVTTMKTGISHKVDYEVAGKRVAGRNDIPAYLPDSYEQAGVPKGKLEGKFVHKSKIYAGMESDYWIYVPAQYSASTAAALMVWQDGAGLVQRDGATRAQIVFDNLTHQKKIPVMVHVFIQPGLVGTRRMRSIEYDTVNDTYARFLRDEVLPEVYAKYNIRRNGYSRAIAGNSSGGICAFNVAWHQPDQFARVLSRIGSFTSIQWQPGVIDGGNVYPNKIRKEPKRAIRVWLQDGSEDLENEHGSWPLQNLQMANSLKMMGYDYRLTFGNGTHSGAHGNSQLAEEMTWLWRGYEAGKTADGFAQEAGERDLPLWRVRGVGR